MDDENQVAVGAEGQQSEGNTENHGQDTTPQEDQRYLDQKKRAEIAEAELKKYKTGEIQPNTSTAKPEEAQNTLTSDRDENYLVSVLSAKGLAYDEINTYLDKSKKIAAIEGIHLAKVIDTDFFKSFDKSFQAEKTAQQAAMGASRGSGASAAQKTLQTPNLPDEEFNVMLRDTILNGQK